VTLDEARSLAFADLRRGALPNQAAYAQAIEARERLVHALGEATQPDPPMRVVAEALRRAEVYRTALDALRRRPAEPIEMTPAEAAAMMARQRPSGPGAAALPPVAETPQGQAPDEGQGSEIGYVIGAALAWLIHALGGL